MNRHQAALLLFLILLLFVAYGRRPLLLILKV